MSYRYIRIFLAILFFMAFIVYLMDSENRKSNKGFSVKILQTVEHTALDATRRGIEDYLKECW